MNQHAKPTPEAKADAAKNEASAKTQPRKPFTITGLTGYHASGNKVTLFLSRRLSARSITLDADRLQQLAEMAQQS